jgi:hypothetical protein
MSFCYFDMILPVDGIIAMSQGIRDLTFRDPRTRSHRPEPVKDLTWVSVSELIGSDSLSEQILYKLL